MDIKIERMDIHDDEPIDLRTPVNAVAPPIVMIDSATQVYVARRTIVTEYPSCTLVLNSPRRSILPAFPTSIDNGDQAHLLLANVPSK